MPLQTLVRMPTLQADLGCRLNPDVLMDVLDAIDYGIAVLDAEQLVLACNRTGQEMFAKANLFSLSVRGRIVPQGAGRADYEKALAQAFSGKRAFFFLEDAGQQTACATVPILPAEYRRSILLVVGRSRVCQPLSLRLFAQQSGLSAAEADVLAGLSDGLEPAEIARAHGVALNTVRTQILSIRSKTQAPSIRALVQRLATLPPVLPSLSLSPSN